MLSYECHSHWHDLQNQQVGFIAFSLNGTRARYDFIAISYP